VEKSHVLKSVTKVFTGGAPVFLDVLEQAQRVAPQATVTTVYGSTEAEPVAEIAYHAMSDADKRSTVEGGGLLVGRPVSAIQVRILPDRWGTPLDPLQTEEFEALSLGPGEAGELVVSGPHVLPGYWQGEGDRETKFRVDHTIWHRTGDAGMLDEQARIWLLGRCVARIDDEAGTLYPFTVECAIHRHPQVKRAAMVSHEGKRLLVLELYGRTDPVWLDTVKRELSWAHLDEIRILRRIPVDKRHNAKIDYAALSRLLQGG
jgi:acyl-CoA synthetase (AMP-forming)/AMP-acid ligase II